METTRLWGSLFRRLPSGLLTKDVIMWIQSDDSDRLVEFLRGKCQEAFDQEQAFYDQHANASRQAKVQLEPLTDEESAWIEWYKDQLSQYRKRTQLLVRCLRDANDIAWIEPPRERHSGDTPD